MEANGTPGHEMILIPSGTGLSLTLSGSGENGALTGDLDILDDLTIAGGGMMVSAVEASSLGDRALHVLPGAALALSGISIVYADAGSSASGGGLLNEGSVSMVETAFQFNHAQDGGGVLNLGNMTLRRSLIAYNFATTGGAGIRNAGTLIVEGSTIANNEALNGPGGGIVNHVTATIRNSTISLNRATFRGAGISNEGGTLTLNNASVIYNLIVPDQPEAPSAGGIFNDNLASVQLSNTIVAVNAVGLGGSYIDCAGTLDSAGYNLIGTATGCTMAGDLTGNIVGVDPLLPSLPTVDPAQTWGYPPLAGSPAIDAGNPAPVGSSGIACEIIDQAGTARPIGSICDIGAYESEFGAVGTPSWTPTASDTPTATATATITPGPSLAAWTVGSDLTIGAFFGGSVAFADVQADGYADAVIGAGSHTDGQHHEGAAFLYSGAASGPDFEPDWAVQSNQASAVLGNPLADAGDLNGDGYQDLVVSAYLYSAGQASEGAVFAYHGSPTGPSPTADWMTEGDQAGAFFGWAVDGVGDVNGDGFDDIVIGARYYDGLHTDEGAAFLYLGSAAGLQPSPAWRVTGGVDRVGMGYAVAGAGDVNRDGFDDVVVSAALMEPMENEGTVFLYTGSSTGLELTPAWSIGNAIPNDGFGADLATAGDVNRDGFDDFLVGAPGDAYLGAPGRAYLFYGSATGPADVPSWVGGDGTLSSRFGAAVNSAGDFNADGYPDIAVGAPNYYVGGSYGIVGRLTLYLGSSDGISSSPDWTFLGQNNSDFASSLAQASDANGDGFDDLLVGAQNWDNDPFGEGRAFIFFGWDLPASAPPPTPGPSVTPWASRTPTPTATFTATATPTQTASPSPAALFADGFESGDLSAWSSNQTDGGDLSVASAAAIGGSYGLQAVLDDNRSIYVVDETPSGEIAYRTRFYFDPNGVSMASGNAHVILLARDAASMVAFRVELRSFQGDYQVRAVAPLDDAPAYVTPWIPLTDAPHFLEVSWWAATAENIWDGGLQFWVDGEIQAGDDGLDLDRPRVDSVRLGAVAGVDGGTRGTYFFDAFTSTEGLPIGPDASIILPPSTPVPDAIFADGFETGDLSAWSEVRSDGDLSVRASAALGGAYGMKVLVDDTSPLYVTDWSPFGEKQYRARFLFDPNSLRMLDGRSHFVFQALMESSKVVARVEVRFKSGAYQLRAGAWDESGSWRNSSWWNIDDATHVVELQWQASAGYPVDGVMSLWLDGVEVEILEAINSSGLQVDFVRLGAVAGLDNGTHGSMYFDAFESRRETYIGPPSGP